MYHIIKRPGQLCTIIAINALLIASANGHIHLHAPNGGESFEAGETVTVRWEILVSHKTQNWDLWYSVTGENGPWIPVSTNLPPGDTSEGAIHEFSWTVPEDVSDQCRIRVRQDNSGTDWEDISDSNFSITPLPTTAEGSKLLDGVNVAGQVSDLFSSDDQYYELDPFPTSNPIKQKVHMVLQATSPTSVPGLFRFRLEAAMMGGPSGDVMQRVLLFNYDTGVPELVDIRAAPNAEDSIEVDPGGDLSRFLNPFNDEITAEVIWTSDEFSGASFNWAIDVDEAVWVISD